jgi:2-isopropylmalate synthase
MVLEILDSTLRDGAQGENVNFSAADKAAVIRALAEFGIPFIEAGNPGSNPKDFELFKAFADKPLSINSYDNSYDNSSENNSENKDNKTRQIKLVAFGSTRRKNIKCEDDPLFLRLLDTPAEVLSLFGKASPFHVTEILGAELDENIRMITDSVSFAVKANKTVFFDAEHFFDGYKLDADYALAVLKAAKQAGASRLILCDTNGGTFPDEIYEITKAVIAFFDGNVKVGIHCHNDCGCADANVYAAVRAGATHIQGTFTGIGERCGNTNLSAVIPALQAKRGYECVPDLTELTATARRVAEITNIRLSDGLPFVGKSAFSHKGGMHADGVLKNPASYEHIDPSAVGNERNILLSEVAGRAAVLSKVEHIAKLLPGFTGERLAALLSKDSPEIQEILAAIKERESRGYQYEGADASFELLVREHLGFAPEYFVLDYYQIHGGKTGDAEPLTNAIIKARVGELTKLRVHEGDGPVNAIDKALRKALAQFYPVLEDVRLSDYKVRIMDSKKATAADVRVLIESTDGVNVWTTVGASTNIINASVSALIDSIKYKLMLEDKNDSGITG